MDLEQETDLDPEIKGWLAFAVQKLDELALLAKGLGPHPEDAKAGLRESRQKIESRRSSPLVHRPGVRSRLAKVLRGHREP